jgi:exopolysaccharide production protein ExoQ
MLQDVIEKVMFVLAALTFSGALWRFLSGGGGGGNDGDPLTQVVLGCVYCVLAIFALMEIRRTALSLYRNPALLGLLLVACVSHMWSDSADLVFRRAIALTGTTLFGIVLATRCSLDEQLGTLRWAFRSAAAATIALLLLSPSRALAAPGTAEGLRGVFTHKNELGAAMALAFLVECYLRDPKGKAEMLRLPSLCVYGGLLLASDSMTSIVTVFVVLGGVWIVRVPCARHGVPLPAISVYAVVAGFALTLTGFGPGDLLGLLGRSPDLAGRLELWKAVTVAIAQKPFLGYGFSGFWKGASAASETVERQILWTPVYAHNGYLEIALSLGLVGLFLAMVFLMQGFRRAWGQGREGDSWRSFWPLALLLFVAIHNLCECSIAWQNSLEWAVCVATIVGGDPKLRALFESQEEIEDTSNEPASECA